MEYFFHGEEEEEEEEAEEKNEEERGSQEWRQGTGEQEMGRRGLNRFPTHSHSLFLTLSLSISVSGCLNIPSSGEEERPRVNGCLG